MEEEKEEEKPFAAERAKTGRAKCKKCKCPIEKDTVRIAKLVANPFSEGKMKAWHHLTCLFEVFAKQRATTKRIDDPTEDIDGWEGLVEEDRRSIVEKLEEFEKSAPFKAAAGSANKTPPKKRKRSSPKETDTKPFAKQESKRAKGDDSVSTISDVDSPIAKKRSPTRDDAFSEFQRICNEVANVDAYTDKTAIVKKLFTRGSTGDGFKSDVKLWCKLLLPGAEKRIYNLRSKQLVKLFARLLIQSEDDMLEHLEQGDVAETICQFFGKSDAYSPAAKSSLTIQQVDEFLERLSFLTKEEDQTQHFGSILARCTANDLKTIVRLINHDLRINAGPKHILSAVHDDAYRAFQTSRDLSSVVERCLEGSSIGSVPEKTLFSGRSSGGDKVALSLMTPVLPMLAEACKSVEMAMKKCPNGMLSEVKYDGERVQVHKKGTEFRYFSRSLKPVLPHKVNHFKEYIPRAFPDGDDLILDAEVLMIDNKTGQPLPFGSLGIHKKAEFKDANVCLFVFDCIYYNGEVLLAKSMMERRRILRKRMTEIPNRIMLSEVQEVHNPRDLAEMIAKVLKMGLEGLVLKDVDGKYEPGKRHWLKVKKDYLFDGAMADTADLVVLGAWYGTGNKGGMMSVFLMGCYDERQDRWLTVTKVHTGHDDATLARLQDELDMVKIGKDPAKLPRWLLANKPMVPDFVAKDPKKQPVWEITGAEFTNQGVHTADGISIRFPRVTRIRTDKDWSTATTLKELRDLFQKSSESIDLSLLLPSNSEPKNSQEKSPAKQESSPRKKPKRKERSLFLDDSDSEGPGTSTEKNREESKKVSSEVRNEPTKWSSKDDICRGKSKGRDRSSAKEQVDDRTVKIESSEDEDSEEAEYYAFVKNDYIEYTASGSPLNWIEGRKPPKGLPPNARPLSRIKDEELRSHAVLKDVRVTFAKDLAANSRTRARRILNTLGARILKKRDRSRTTHVIHSCTEIPSSALQEFDRLPRTARHVSVSWLEATAATSEVQETEEHAVTIIADYCSCCSHR